jgi:DNA-binding response OmpR family regulator
LRPRIGAATSERQPDTILVVEDEAEISEVIATALEDDGYRVLTARDGRDALELVQQEPPDMIVLDLMLPHVGGRKVIQRCRTQQTTTDIPIIVVSAVRDAPQDAEIQDLVFVEKPFDLDVLMVLVEDALPPRRIDAVA